MNALDALRAGTLAERERAAWIAGRTDEAAALGLIADQDSERAELQTKLDDAPTDDAIDEARDEGAEAALDVAGDIARRHARALGDARIALGWAEWAIMDALARGEPDPILLRAALDHLRLAGERVELVEVEVDDYDATYATRERERDEERRAKRGAR